MSEAWRTPTVVSICEAIKQTEDYTALPILADALDDADYPDQWVLKGLRSGVMNPIEAQRLIALLHSEESAQAVKKIDELAEQMGARLFENEGDNEYDAPKPTTYERLMRIGNRYITADGSYAAYTTELGSRELEYDWNPEEFWKAYCLITGKAGHGNPFIGVEPDYACSDCYN